MKISIIICTYNRAESLKRTLNSIMTMSVPEDISWEIITVDNNSPDNTKEVVEDFKIKSGLNVVYVFEEKKGLSNARNCGIKKAKGEIIAFTDDDVIVDKKWLVNVVKAFKDNDAACAGGKILPVWEKSPPKWLKKDLYGYLALLDLGDQYIRMTEPKLWGANFAVKSSMFQKYGYFNTALGRTPTKLYGGEEKKFIEILIKNEEKIYYSPHMLVHHCISKDRMKKSYFRKWVYDLGELYGIQKDSPTFYRNIRVIVYAIKMVAMKFCKFLWFQAIKPQNAFREQLLGIYYIGFFVGRMK